MFSDRPNATWGEWFWMIIFVLFLACITPYDKHPRDYKLYICPYNDEYQNIYYKKYENEYLGISGLDLVLSYNISLRPKQYTVIEYFSSFTMTPRFYEMKSLDMFTRSRLSQYPLVFVNGVGIIDAGFQGNLSTTVYNPNNYTINLTKGMKVVQIGLADSSKFDIIVDCTRHKK
ncbi:MAG: hypothetical protein Dasosvirus11_8 [Dasosvirus sp.]|uniref:dUTP diphosphatase n=1 Tax=Dasosvirus sp. TaxID=2487764 RepID=A0A3G4ZRT4_9VIRU|nr:MAG: hypothetical protein Dasosvirus11_8 [Dasosvirus sp.]